MRVPPAGAHHLGDERGEMNRESEAHVPPARSRARGRAAPRWGDMRSGSLLARSLPKAGGRLGRRWLVRTDRATEAAARSVLGAAAGLSLLHRWHEPRMEHRCLGFSRSAMSRRAMIRFAMVVMVAGGSWTPWLSLPDIYGIMANSVDDSGKLSRALRTHTRGSSLERSAGRRRWRANRRREASMKPRVGRVPQSRSARLPEAFENL
jgi:hypothetical protein